MSEKKNGNLSVLLNGIIKENPVLILILGTCPTLATSTSVTSAAMRKGAATQVRMSDFLAVFSLKKRPKASRNQRYVGRRARRRMPTPSSTGFHLSTHMSN